VEDLAGEGRSRSFCRRGAKRAEEREAEVGNPLIVLCAEQLGQ
jgi:hypothetical protein